MSRTSRNMLLLLTGVSAGLIVINGSYTRYVKPGMFGWLIAAAVVLILIALAPGGSGSTSDCDDHRHSTTVVWLLVIPIALLLYVSPPPLGALAAEPAAIQVTEPDLHRAYPTLPDEPAPTLTIIEVIERMRWDTGHTLDGRTISVIGFSLEDKGIHFVGRFHIICCAADARVLGLRLLGPLAAQAAGFPRDAWLRIEGKPIPGADPPTKATGPALMVTAITPVEPPTDPYMYSAP
ncbi:TIGR03943 family putative permease subunit [Mycobacterium sp. PDNC021]|uniref:TIGR03943 family putative permease subunit n=1 Tax=Mycobacterium sp. PDNC021 TaxID=3391399 RepID=UPI003AAEE190